MDRKNVLPFIPSLPDQEKREAYTHRMKSYVRLSNRLKGKNLISAFKLSVQSIRMIKGRKIQC